MEVRIGRWVIRDHRKYPAVPTEPVDENAPTIQFEINRNNNLECVPSPKQDRDLIMSVKQLEAQLLRLEADSAEKDLVVKGLEKELTEIKGARAAIQNEISSRDAEIKMQKDVRRRMFHRDQMESDLSRSHCQHGKWENSGGGDPNWRPWSVDEVAEAEQWVSDLKSGSAHLFQRTELLEKNILIYQSHQIFTQLENDYFPLLDSSNNEVEESGTDWSRGKSFWSFDHNGNNSTEINYRVLREELDEVKEENFLLRRRLEEVMNHVKDLQSELPVDVKHNSDQEAPDLSRLSNYIHGLFGKLEEKRKLIIRQESHNSGSFWIKKSIAQVPKPRCISKYTEASSSRAQGTVPGEPPGIRAATAEIIRLQAEQIARFESYVGRLHAEIREWVNPGGVLVPALAVVTTFDPDASDSVIETLRNKIEEDVQQSQAKESAANAELKSRLEEMKVLYEESKGNEVKLHSENNLLRGMVSDMNKLYVVKRNLVNHISNS